MNKTDNGKKVASLIALEKLLCNIIKNPKNYIDDQLLNDSLSSQGKLSSMAYKFSEAEAEYVVKPMSLNSMKSHSQALFATGYSRINELRKSALSSLETARLTLEAPNKRTRRGLNLKVEQLDGALEMQQKAIIILLQAINASIHAIKITNKTLDPKLRDKRSQDALTEIQNILGLCPVSINETKSEGSSVTNIEDYRRD